MVFVDSLPLSDLKKRCIRATNAHHMQGYVILKYVKEGLLTEIHPKQFKLPVIVDWWFVLQAACWTLCVSCACYE